jgi:hypothetical protein
MTSEHDQHDASEGLRPAPRGPRAGDLPGGASNEPIPDEVSREREAERPLHRPRRRWIVLGVMIAVVGAVATWAFFGGWFGDSSDPRERALQQAADERDREREELFRWAQGDEVRYQLRIVLDDAVTTAERIAVMRRLGGEAQIVWHSQMLGWLVRYDASPEIRLAAVAQLDQLDSATAQRELVRAARSPLPDDVLDAVTEALVRGRDVEAAKVLLGLMVSGERGLSAHWAAALSRMTGLNSLGPWPPRTEADRLEYARLVQRWIDAGGPAPGVLSPEVPAPDVIALMPEDRRLALSLTLVDLAVRRTPDAWNRVAQIAAQDKSPTLCSRLAERLMTESSAEALLVQVLLVDRVDAATTAHLATHLAALRGEAAPARPVQARLAGVFAAEPIRAWFRREHTDLAAQYAALLPERTEQQTLDAAVDVLALTPEAERPVEAAVAVAEVRRGRASAAALLVMLLRQRLAGPAADEAMAALAALGTRQVWFLLVDELLQGERLPVETEAALHGGAFRDRLPAWPTYGPTALERYLAWQFAMRFGLKHLDRLPDAPLARSWRDQAALLPVLIPKEPPGTVAQALQKALTLHKRLSPQERDEVLTRLPGYVAAGDEVASALQAALAPRK